MITRLWFIQIDLKAIFVESREAEVVQRMTTIVNPGFEETRPEKVQPSGDHNHQSVMTEIDKINKELNQLKDNLAATSVRCYMLEVELATQFTPYMVSAVKTVKQDCTRCMQTIQNTVDSTQMDQTSA